jgi:hypothetical protein
MPAESIGGIAGGWAIDVVVELTSRRKTAHKRKMLASIRLTWGRRTRPAQSGGLLARQFAGSNRIA